MVVMDRLSKYAHFGTLKWGFDAPRVVKLFVDTVVKLHGFPKKLLSDRDSIFMSDFWTELMTLSGTKLQFTTAYHPQTDGQSEVTNRSLEQYLRAFVFDQPNKWYELLPWAEFAMNCRMNISIGITPFQALYGREPPSLFATASKLARNMAVKEMLVEREKMLRKLKDHLLRSQRDMSVYANRHRRDVEFNVGDHVFLHLQPYSQHSVARPISAKLSRRYYGPYAITERIEKVAYRLQLPIDSNIHDVFHVSLLKPFVPPLSEGVSSQLPIELRNNHPIDVPIRAADSRQILVKGIPQEQWQIFWSSTPTSSPTWEPADEMRGNFPHLHHEDKVAFIDGGVDRGSNVDAPTTSNTSGDHLTPQPDNEQLRTSIADRAQEGDRPKIVESGRPKRATKKPTRYKDFSSK